MNLARRLYEQFRTLIHEVAKFGVIGMIGFVITVGGADVLRYGVGLGKYKAVIVATVVATIATFLGNRYWTFRHRERTGMGRETVLFFVYNGVGLLIQLACVAIVQDGLGLGSKTWYNIANLIGIVLGTLFRFYAYRKWVWKTQPASGAVAGDDLISPPGDDSPGLGQAASPAGQAASGNEPGSHDSNPAAALPPRTPRTMAGPGAPLGGR